MTILALRCIVKDHRHRNLQHSIRRPSISLARQQQPDGSFGNLYNTALTLQVSLHYLDTWVETIEFLLFRHYTTFPKQTLIGTKV